jgi:hypothetical protein
MKATNHISLKCPKCNRMVHFLPGSLPPATPDASPTPGAELEKQLRKKEREIQLENIALRKRIAELEALASADVPKMPPLAKKKPANNVFEVLEYPMPAQHIPQDWARNNWAKRMKVANEKHYLDQLHYLVHATHYAQTDHFRTEFEKQSRTKKYDFDKCIDKKELLSMWTDKISKCPEFEAYFQQFQASKSVWNPRHYNDHKWNEPLTNWSAFSRLHNIKTAQDTAFYNQNMQLLIGLDGAWDSAGISVVHQTDEKTGEPIPVALKINSTGLVVGYHI